MLTMNLTGTRALTRGEQKLVVLTVRNPDQSLRDLTGHTCQVVARPDYGHPTAWCDLDETDGVTLGGALGTISMLFPGISTSRGEAGMLGVWTCALKDSDGALVAHVGGEIELDPTAIE